VAGLWGWAEDLFGERVKLVILSLIVFELRYIFCCIIAGFLLHREDLEVFYSPERQREFLHG
jgi:hypothetical protein